MTDQSNVNDIIQEAIAAAQAAEQQAGADQPEAGKLAQAFKAAAPILKGLEVLKNHSVHGGIFRRPKFNFKAGEKGDHVRISTTVQFFKSEKSSLSINVYNSGAMTVLFNDPGSYKGGAISSSADIINIVAKGAAKSGFIG
jgi:hypothetical protein